MKVVNRMNSSKELFVLFLSLLAIFVTATAFKCPGLCKRLCKSGFRKDANGCSICKCVDPCEDKSCAKDFYCERQNVTCIRKPCYDIGVCKKKDCGPVCKMYCASGMQTDLNGCPICKCVDPCESNPCSEGMMCTRKPVKCIRAPCYDVAECICPMLKCRTCKYGNVLDKNGCNTCECVDACAVMKCGSPAPYCYDGACHTAPKP